MRPRGGMSMGRGVTIPGGLGLAGVIIFLLIQVLSGGSSGAYSVDDPFGASPQAPAPGETQGIPAAQDPERDLKDFSTYVFSLTLDTWAKIFKQDGNGFQRAKVVLYRDAVSTGCGDASSAVGPFYCPADERVYLDLSFYNDMETKLGAPGDFAWAYVIAHEVGRHVQRGHAHAAREPGRRQRAVGAAGASGGLLRRRVGAQRLRGRRPREGRRARGDRRGRRGGRRPAPAPGHRPRESRHLHARHLRAADGLVQPRPGQRLARRLRHVLARRGLAAADPLAADRPVARIHA